MTVQLNHTIVYARDRETAARFFTDLLGLPEATDFGPFRVVAVGGGVSLDVMTVAGEIQPQHYAFLVGDDEFDQIFARITERGLPYWADPHHHQPSRINRADGGRGLYWESPDGHNLEILTVPYGGWN